MFTVGAHFTELVGAHGVKCSLHMEKCILKYTRILLGQLNGPRLECHPENQKTGSPSDVASAPGGNALSDVGNL